MRHSPVTAALPLLAVLATLLSACGGDKSAPAPTPDPEADHGESIEVDPRALDSPIREVRDIARAVAGGDRSSRAIQAYWRMALQYAPFSATPPPDSLARALAERASLPPFHTAALVELRRLPPAVPGDGIVHPFPGSGLPGPAGTASNAATPAPTASPTGAVTPGGAVTPPGAVTPDPAGPTGDAGTPPILALTTSWRQMGPRPVAGRMTALAIEPLPGGRLVAGSAGGGVWTMRPGVTAWQARSDDQPSLAIGAIGVDWPNRLVYAGTGEGNYMIDGLYGAGLLVGQLDPTGEAIAWSRVPLPVRAFHEIAVAATGEAWAATLDGLWRKPATPPGASWSEVDLAPGGAPLPLLGLDVSSVVVVSADGAQVLAAVSAVAGPGAGPGALLRTTDGGGTWLPAPGFPAGPGVGRIALARAPSNPARVYAVVATPSGALHGVYRSDSAGSAWVARPGAPDRCNGDCEHHLAIGVDAGNPDDVWIAGVWPVRSTNGGATWVDVPAASLHADVHAIVSTVPGTVWLATDGGVFRRDASEVAWRDMSGTLDTAQFYHVTTDPEDDNYLIGGTQDQGVQYYCGAACGLTAGGTVLGKTIGGDGGYTAIATGAGTRRHYAATKNGLVHRSANLWQTTASQLLAPEAKGPLVPLVIDRQVPPTLFVGARAVWRNPGDPGAPNPDDSWLALNPAPSPAQFVSGLDATKQVAGSLWYGTSRGIVRHTASSLAAAPIWDPGALTFAGRAITSVGPHPREPRVAYVTVSGTADHVWKTIDGGATWSDQTANLASQAVPFNCVLVVEDEPRLVLAAAESGVFARFADDGPWRPLGTGLPNVAVNWLSYSAKSGMLRAGTHGRSVWELVLPR